MKTTAKNVIREESGKILILVLVLLVVGGLLLTPLLGLMSTGLMAGQVYEKKASELYAADAGVEDAVWRIQNSPPASYPYTYAEALSVNEKDVEVTIDREFVRKVGCHKEYRYYILAEAIAGGSGTDVNAVLSVSYFSLNPLDYAIVSDGSITIMPSELVGTGVHGDVWLYDRDPIHLEGEEYIYGDVVDAVNDKVALDWPRYDELSARYGEDVEGLEPHPDNRIGIPDARIGQSSLWAPSSGKLTVKGTGRFELGGTMYVMGDLDFTATPSIDLALSGQTIFVNGDIYIPPGTTLTGPGCIIATGEVWFQPMMASSDYVLVMSLNDQVWFNPRGGFKGTVVGQEHVHLQPNNRLEWTEPPDNLNFPMGEYGDNENTEGLPIRDLSIASWEIQQGGQ